MQYIIVKEDKKYPSPDSLFGATHTVGQLAKDMEAIKRYRCIYVHFADLEALEAMEHWKGIASECAKVGVRIIYFTSEAIFRWEPDQWAIDPSRSEFLPIMPWNELESHLGDLDHPGHQPPPSLVHLEALCLMCQGYLMVRAEEVRYGATFRDSHSALQRMGWVDSGSEMLRSLHLDTDLTEQINRVQQPEWWAVSDDFTDRVEQEWNPHRYGKIPAPVTTLLRGIHQRNRISDYAAIAEAYSLIADRLHGKPADLNQV